MRPEDTEAERDPARAAAAAAAAALPPPPPAWGGCFRSWGRSVSWCCSAVPGGVWAPVRPSRRAACTHLGRRRERRRGRGLPGGRALPAAAGLADVRTVSAGCLRG